MTTSPIKKYAHRDSSIPTVMWAVFVNGFVSEPTALFEEKIDALHFADQMGGTIKHVWLTVSQYGDEELPRIGWTTEQLST